ncbi:MAG TPA: hypothetical protein VGD62_02215 [Acidobacteriaceae bacterium]
MSKAIATLIVGILLFAVGVVGQSLTRAKKPVAHHHDRRGFTLIVTIGSIVLGAWLLIISTVHLLHLHHKALHS